MQAGKQFEWLTGGHINCGFHEVIYTERVEEQKRRALEEGRIPWRVSSTLFSTLGLDVRMKPMGRFANSDSNRLYPEISVGDHTLQELEAINLKPS